MKKMTADEVSLMLKRLYGITGATAFFDEPFFAVASANDPWFEKLKTLIGPFHWTPDEVLKMKFPGKTAKSVIVWCLPVREDIRGENSGENEKPAISWAAMRSYGEVANENMAKQFCALLENAGYAAVAPHLEQVEQGFSVGDFNFCSHWSERHAGFIAGLGTFGMSAGLITERGIAHRLRTVVTDLALPVTERSYGDDPWAWCIRCDACMKRCPAGAVGTSPEERDKKKCALYARDRILPNRAEKYGWLNLNLGCGLCQTKVPCEHARPGKTGKTT